MSKPIICKILKVKTETHKIKTFTIDYKLDAKPGQFVMLWLPGVDQKPISISSQTKNNFDLTIFEIGPATKAMMKLKVGDTVGISGPYGKGFNIKPKSNIILVGGGCGSAPLKLVAEEAKKLKCKVEFISGARTKKDVLFPGSCLVTTDDGSAGFKGYPTQKLEELLKNKKQKYSKVYTCGPEPMMKVLVQICKKYKVLCEISMERYMKCGYGVCGQCAVDPLGICICQDGPVFSGQLAEKITEFGKYHRDKSGTKHNF
ncbi:MAG: dihydroorotate dehydrogenase electron transfer subunit [Patescibacteria group bacterium]